MRPLTPGRILPLLKSLVIFAALTTLIFIGLSTEFFPDVSETAVPTMSNNNPLKTRIDFPNILRGVTGNVLSQHIPGLDNLKMTELPNVGQQDIINFCLFILTGVKLNEPLAYLQAEVPVMKNIPIEIENQDELQPDTITEPPASQAEETVPKIDNKIVTDLPLVAFYSTHSSETYQLTDGNAHAKGKAGAILEVAQAFAKDIETKYRIPTVFSDKIHDLAFNKSYVESEKTVLDFLKNYKSLKILLDIHRDSSLPRDRTKVQINGKSCAKVLIVVGTDARASHPKWRENLAFARKVAAKMDQLYPGLSRGISVKQGRYNQQYKTTALLMEIGSVNNTKEEALNSVSLLADVMAAVLNEMK